MNRCKAAGLRRNIHKVFGPQVGLSTKTTPLHPMSASVLRTLYRHLLAQTKESANVQG